MTGKKVATVRVNGQDYTAVQILNERADRLDEILPGTTGRRPSSGQG